MFEATPKTQVAHGHGSHWIIVRPWILVFKMRFSSLTVKAAQM